MRNKELVSIIIITHNRSDLLKKAINSVLNQTYKNIELIIVDDFSTDNTYNVVKEIQNKIVKIPIIYIKLDKPSGANVARNTGILHAKGKFITGLDDDDEMLPERIEKLVNAFDEKYAYVFSQVYFKTLKNIYKYDFCRFKSFITLEDMLFFNCTGNQVLTTKSMLLKAGLYDVNLKAAQDYDMWLRLLLIKPIAKKVSEPLMIIDRNDNIQRISTSKKKISGYFNVYKKFKSYMTLNHKKFQLYKLYEQKNKNFNIKKFFLFFPYKNTFIYIYKVTMKVIKEYK